MRSLQKVERDPANGASLSHLCLPGLRRRRPPAYFSARRDGTRRRLRLKSMKAGQQAPARRTETIMQKQTLFTSLTLAAMVAAGLSTAALAQDAPPPPPEPELGMDFEALDADKDGKVTEAEIAAAMAAKLAAADTNKDGKLSAEELVAMREQERAARQLEMAKMMVTRLDRDGDGLVSA